MTSGLWYMPTVAVIPMRAATDWLDRDTFTRLMKTTFSCLYHRQAPRILCTFFCIPWQIKLPPPHRGRSGKGAIDFFHFKIVHSGAFSYTNFIVLFAFPPHTSSLNAFGASILAPSALDLPLFFWQIEHCIHILLYQPRRSTTAKSTARPSCLVGVK